MLVKPGKRFCGEHEVHLGEQKTDDDGKDSASERIPCPYDPKHTCNKKRLETHLKKCGARPK